MLPGILIKAVAAVLLAASVQPMAELEAVENSAACKSCADPVELSEMRGGFCPSCWEAVGGFCDCCGEPLDGSEGWIVCDCHGIHGSVCEECADWHAGLE